MAISENRNKSLDLRVGTADKINFRKKFDLIIYGFCLYLCDEEDYKKIFHEACLKLKKKGFIIIFDFFSTKKIKSKYKHDSNIITTKFDFKKIFIKNNVFCIISERKFKIKDKNNLFTDYSAIILKKNES